MTNLEWAIQQTVHSKRGLSKQIADLLGTSQHVVLNKANPDNELNHFHVAQVQQIMELTGDVRILEELAHELGYSIVANQAVPVSITEAVLSSVKEQGDVSDAITKALADNVIKPKEERDICKEIAEARRALDVMEASIHQAADESRGVRQ